MKTDTQRGWEERLGDKGIKILACIPPLREPEKIIEAMEGLMDYVSLWEKKALQSYRQQLRKKVEGLIANANYKGANGGKMQALEDLLTIISE